MVGPATENDPTDKCAVVVSWYTVHPDGDDELNVAADDWRCWR